MKKNYRFCLLCICIVALVNFSSCWTFNQKNYSKGRFINGVLSEFSDLSIPIEEQCYLVCLDPFTDIIEINGTDAKVGKRATLSAHAFSFIYIFPPEKNNFIFRYFDGNSKRVRIQATYDLKAGHYYSFFYVQNELIFFDLEERASVPVTFSGFTMKIEEMPIEVVIKGADTKIASKYKGFEGGKKDTLTKEEQAIVDALLEIIENYD